MDEHLLGAVTTAAEVIESRPDRPTKLVEVVAQAQRCLPEFEHVEKVLPVEIRDAAQLADYEETCLTDGYEGVMIRTPDSPYKCGRSTEREGWLLKIKRFEDAEAVVLDTYEGMSNHNEAQRDAFGRTKRSSAQAGKVGRGELGGFVVAVHVGGGEPVSGHADLPGNDGRPGR